MTPHEGEQTSLWSPVDNDACSDVPIVQKIEIFWQIIIMISARLFVTLVTIQSVIGFSTRFCVVKSRRSLPFTTLRNSVEDENGAEKVVEEVDMASITSRRKLVGEDLGAEFTDFKKAPSSVVLSDKDGSKTASLMEEEDYYDEWEGFVEKPNWNNRFFKSEEERAKWESHYATLTPDEALQLSRQVARKDNNMWLDRERHELYTERKLGMLKDYLVGTTREGDVSEEIREKIKPVMKVMGSVIEILSVTDGAYRFKYYGLLKNKFGTECWCKQLLQETGLEVTGVYFEAGDREYDAEDNGVGNLYS